MNGAATVFIVNDAQEVRGGLARLFAAAGYQVREFESAEHFLAERDINAPGCLLADVWMPGLNGLEFQSALARTPYAPPIVFLTACGDIATAVQAMKAGANDFLERPIDDARLFAAVEKAIRRDRAQRLEREINDSIEARLGRLTHRERQVMRHLIRGQLNKQIAWDLGVSEKTIKVHRLRVMTKMGVRSLPELVWLASRVSTSIESVGIVSRNCTLTREAPGPGTDPSAAAVCRHRMLNPRTNAPSRTDFVAA
jgi:FixJ family two-component response regulator